MKGETEYGWSAPDGEAKNEEESGGKNAERKANRQLLTTIQVSACLLILAAALVLKFSGGEAYQNALAWYSDAMSDSLTAELKTEGVKQYLVDLWGNVKERESSSPEAAVSQESGEFFPESTPGVSPAGGSAPEESTACR